MIGDLWRGARDSAPHARGIAIGLLAIAVCLFLVADPHEVRQAFYMVLATTIPVLLFALLLRLAALRDTIVETLDSTRETSDIDELREKADPDDSAIHAKLSEIAERRARNAVEVETLAPRALVALIVALVVAASAEIACLAALATNQSTTVSFYVASLGTACIGYAVASNEIASYKLSFGARGLLLPARLRPPLDQ